MPDLEKVIKGLETCSDVYYGADGACSSCPYSQINGDRCVAELVHDTIKLLKEQENLVGRHKILVEKFDDLLASLKEQYPVEPVKKDHMLEIIAQYEYECSCGAPLFIRQPYCGGCGKAVKWDG